MKKDSVFNKTSKTIADSYEQALQQFKSGLSGLADLSTSTKDKFIEYVEGILNVLPLIEEAGFRTNRLIVGISIPPSIEIHFSRFKELSNYESEKLLEQYADRKMFKLIFNALKMSNDMQGKLSTDSLVFSETCIEISIPPKVSIKYLHKDLAKLITVEHEFN